MQYKAIITTLTPLHIGTGTELLNDYDFIVDRAKRKTYRLNIDAVFEFVLTNDQPQLDQRLLEAVPTQLVKVTDLNQHPELAMYILDGHPQPKTAGAGQIKEQIKDVWGKLYLPGSSLKGALRTAIARNIAADEAMKAGLQVNMGRDRNRQPDPKAADDLMERHIFRVNPNRVKRGQSEMNYDLLRALQVADSHPVEADPLLLNVRIVKGNKLESPVDIEAVPPRVTFETTIRTEQYLYVDQAEKLGWEETRTRWLNNLPVAARNVARERFKQEQAYFKQVGLNHLVKLYQQWQTELEQLRGSNHFFLQLGWGGGWENKTLGQSLIAPDDREFANLRNAFGLGKPPRRRDWQAREGDLFPSSRRLVVNEQGHPVVPLGWVEVSLEKREVS